MRSKRSIEIQLEHIKRGECTGGAADDAAWIAALEWVLGDADHRARRAELIATIKALAVKTEHFDQQVRAITDPSLALKVERACHASTSIALTHALELIE